MTSFCCFSDTDGELTRCRVLMISLLFALEFWSINKLYVRIQLSETERETEGSRAGWVGVLRDRWVEGGGGRGDGREMKEDCQSVCWEVGIYFFPFWTFFYLLFRYTMSCFYFTLLLFFFSYDSCSHKKFSCPTLICFLQTLQSGGVQEGNKNWTIQC